MFANIAFLLHKSIKHLLYLSFCNVRVWTYLHMKGIIMQKSRIKMQTNELCILKSATIIQYTIKGRFMSR